MDPLLLFGHPRNLFVQRLVSVLILVDLFALGVEFVFIIVRSLVGIGLHVLRLLLGEVDWQFASILGVL